jgi:hypothetical protein
MGTRGAFGVVIDGEEKIGYNQFDSYPDGRGLDVLRFARDVEDWDAVKRRARELRVVSRETPPTPEDVERLRDWTDLSVSGQSTDDWYCLTRSAHGNLGEILACGYVEDARHFPLDSLFCEWAYLLNLDAMILEVYMGFQREPHTSGRFAGRTGPGMSDGYVPVRMIGAWSLHELPTDADFVQTCNAAEEARV